MNYKGFTILPKSVEVIVWDEETETFSVTDAKTVYVITDPASTFIYGTKQTVLTAKKAIDRMGKRWLADQTPVEHLESHSD